MVYVGRFYKEDCEKGLDRKLVELKKKETGLNYVNTKNINKSTSNRYLGLFVRRNGNIRGDKLAENKKA